jgi:hypothetical protein
MLRGGDTGTRWIELAAAWAPHIDDRFCSFNDMHAMLAFVGAHDWDRAQRLERALARGQSLPTRHGETTRQLGLPACRALIAFGRGNDTLAATLLASLPAPAHRLGGSHAQRDVLRLTLLRAIERIRRRARPPAHRSPADRCTRLRPPIEQTLPGSQPLSSPMSGVGRPLARYLMSASRRPFCLHWIDSDIERPVSATSQYGQNCDAVGRHKRRPAALCRRASFEVQST